MSRHEVSYDIEPQPLDSARLTLAAALGFPWLFFAVFYVLGIGGVGLTLTFASIPVAIIAGVWAYRSTEPKKHKPGDVMVNYSAGQREGIRSAYSLRIAAVANALVVSGAFTLVSYDPSSSLIPVNLSLDLGSFGLGGLVSLIQLISAVFMLIIAVFAGLGARNLKKEIWFTSDEWKSPTPYDALDYARKGMVLLGHSYMHTLHIKGTEVGYSPTIQRTGGRVLGQTVQAQYGFNGPFILDLEAEKNPHAAITGLSGSGKTWTVKVIVGRYWIAKQIPSHIIDWLGEYSSFVRDLGGVVWTVPDDFKINPLRLLGFTPYERAAEVAESVTYSLALTALQAQEVEQVILKAYEERGIVEETTQEENESKTPPTLQDVITIMESRAGSGYYKGERLTSVQWTISKLHRVDRIFGEEPPNFLEIIMSVPSCINLKPLKGNDVAKAFVTYIMLQRIYHEIQQHKTATSRGLSMLLILDEAHLLLQAKKEEKAMIEAEPLPVRIARLGRGAGFGEIISSQLATDVTHEIAANVATIIAMQHKADKEVTYIEKWIGLSDPESKIFSRLPQGGCFIQTVDPDKPYASLVKVQPIGLEEFVLAKRFSRKAFARLGITAPPRPLPTEPPPTPKQRHPPEPPPAGEKVSDVRYCRQCNRTLVSGAVCCGFCGADVGPLEKESLKEFYDRTIRQPESPPETKPEPEHVPEAPKLPEAKPPETSKPSEAESPETSTPPGPVDADLTEEPADTVRILRTLTMKPHASQSLQTIYPRISYDRMMRILRKLEEQKLIRKDNVANLQGGATTYYSALKDEWLQSEQVEHRAKLDLIGEAAISLRPTRYPPTHSNFPDMVLELAKPRTAIEVETGRKKLTPKELEEWAQNVKERSLRMKCDRTIAVVPSADEKGSRIIEHYREACKRYGIEVTTMAGLLQLLGLAPPKPTGEAQGGEAL